MSNYNQNDYFTPRTQVVKSYTQESSDHESALLWCSQFSSSLYCRFLASHLLRPYHVGPLACPELHYGLPCTLVNPHQRCGYSDSPFARKDTFLYCRFYKLFVGGCRAWVHVQNHKKGIPNPQKGVRNFAKPLKMMKSDITRQIRIQITHFRREIVLQGLEKALELVPDPQTLKKNLKM